jgi:glycosyltransferase involved in cell wall biosynthesis
MALPTVTIVTPSLNQARFLPQTLRCVQEQDYPQVEHLVLDGGSTDETLAILRHAPGIRWISEPDGGQVDALNKGFRLATGTILAWLNADDTMNKDTVSRAVAALQRTGAGLVYGDVEIMDEHGAVLKVSRGIPFDLRVLLYGINYIGQQTAFFNRTLLEQAGPLRTDLDNAFDYELWLRFAQYGRLAYVAGLKAQIRVHPAAKSVAHAHVTRREEQQIRTEYWTNGGWPAVFSRRPLFWLPHCAYRLKRQAMIRFGSSKRLK